MISNNFACGIGLKETDSDLAEFKIRGEGYSVWKCLISQLWYHLCIRPNGDTY